SKTARRASPAKSRTGISSTSSQSAAPDSQSSAMVSTLASPNTFALDLSHVSKTYKGRVRALQDISMRVHAGEVFGLLGPNGAAKSQLVKIMMTGTRPSRAQGTILGRPVGQKATLARVGYLPEHHRFPEYLTGGQVLDFYGALARTPRRERRE